VIFSIAKLNQMRLSTIVFGITLIACWIVAFTWARALKKKNNDPPILLGGLPDLPPIVLPSVANQHGNPDSLSSTSSSSSECSDKDDEAPDADLQKGALDKLHQLTFTPAAPPRSEATSLMDFNVRDIPMFTPLTALRPKP
jgi:hypothetical protein